MRISDKHLVLAFFPDGVAADGAAEQLKATGVAVDDAIGILASDGAGGLDVDKVGATSVAAGVGVGAALLVLGPAFLGFGAATAVVGGGVGMVGGGIAGSLHHKGLKLSDEDKQRIAGDLADGKAAVGVLAHEDQAAAVQQALADLGGTASAHEVVDEAALQAAVEAGPEASA